MSSSSESKNSSDFKQGNYTIQIKQNPLGIKRGDFAWRRDRDSNPGYDYSHTRVPGVHLQPLGHLSIWFIIARLDYFYILSNKRLALKLTLFVSNLAPATGLEPVTYWLTANRSTTELRGNTKLSIHTKLVIVKPINF